MTLSAKQLALGAIALPSIMFDPGDMHLPLSAIKGLRSALIATLRPAVHRSARSQGMMCLMCLHGHRIDPIMAVVWRLLSLVQYYDLEYIDVENDLAYSHWGYLTMLRRMLVPRGVHMLLDGVHFPLFGPIPLRCPIAAKKNSHWHHQWRERLRDLLLRESVERRSDFKAIQNVAIDWDRTLHLHHTLDHKPVMKTYVELILSGALLTRQRTRRSTRSKKEVRCPYGCAAADTPHHRYWSCHRWGPLRSRWKVAADHLHAITQQVGLVPRDSPLLSSCRHTCRW